MKDQGTTTRRRFLGTAAGATGAVLATTVLNPTQAAAAVPGEATSVTAASAGRTLVGSTWALELDGASQGILRSADGGDAFADVITLGNADGTATKHIGQPKYEDFSLDFGFTLGLTFYQWIVDMVGGNAQRKDGAIVSANLNRDVIATRGFHDALITELTIPACDAASKEAGFLSLGIAPESASDLTGSGKLTAQVANQKLWHPANFRLEIDGLDCTKVNKIDALTIKQKVTADQVGENRDFTKEPAGVEYPNLVVTFSVASVASWKAFFSDFVMNGNNGQEQEKSGRLTLLSPDLKTELAVLQLHHIGIYRLDPDPETTGETIARARAELYVEAMNFTTLGSYTLT